MVAPSICAFLENILNSFSRGLPLKRNIMTDFLKGFGSVLNLFPNDEENPIKTSESISDTDAISSDWKTVGDDLRWAMGEMDDELNKR